MKTLVLVSLSALALSAVAAGKPSRDASGIHQQYLQERSHCGDKSGEDKTTCLREAGAAQVEARRGTLAADDTSDYEKNRLARCDLHKNADERDYCLRRMRGEGTTSGSVEGGGILRELVVTVPAEEGSASGSTVR
ncbi:MAG TPA: hypothetical protein VN747_03615 [Burkholderiales bacterium]|nr:hypothetical protein [Burkholderiales bacterium]